jgi:CRISPR-associated protein Csd1
LIRRQAFRNGEQVIVAWDVSSKFVPSPVQNSHDLLGDDALNDVNSFEDFLEVRGGASEAAGIAQSDYGQLLANRLNKKIMGYRQDLGSTKDIVVMGLDSASPGRMAVTYYRELTGSEFLDRLEAWHNDYAWFQTYPQGLRFVGAPALKEIAEAAFGNQLNDNLCKATINRLLPCVTDGVSLPRDLVRSTHNRAVNRMGMEHWKWEKVLGIACALFRGTKKNADNGGYKMALETERTDRDYLYGRLLAAAECLESVALDVAGEKRDTNAARLMQRFSTRPFSTWLQIEQSLAPYKSRLQNRRPRFFEKITNLLDEIHNLFQAGAYMKKEPLDGAFLLGYHCQRHELRTKAKDKSEQNESDMNASNTHEEELENVSYEEN